MDDSTTQSKIRQAAALAVGIGILIGLALSRLSQPVGAAPPLGIWPIAALAAMVWAALHLGVTRHAGRQHSETVKSDRSSR
jgi:hypothetical protein